MKRLLVVANRKRDMLEWAQGIGINPRSCILMLTRDSPDRCRGLSETSTAIVSLSSDALPEEHQTILDIYSHFGAKTFNLSDGAAIREWLATPPTPQTPHPPAPH